MPDIKDMPTPVSIADTDKIAGQGADGTPKGMTAAQLRSYVDGGGGSSLTRPVVTATMGLRTRAPVETPALSVEADIHGRVAGAHTVEARSGIPGLFASQADHAHLKFSVLNEAGPGTDVAGQRAQVMYTASTAGLSSFLAHGYTSQPSYTVVGAEHSIDTSATTVGAAPAYAGTLTLRFSSSPTLTNGQLVLLAVTSAVAGLQASVYGAKVNGAPGLVGGQYEVSLVVSGLDPNHWDNSKKGNVTTQNTDWSLQTLGTEVAGGDKVSLARDSSGPSDQLLATWGTAHGLTPGRAVVVWSDASMTGLTGLIAGDFNSGVVVSTPSTTTALIRVRNLRATGSLRSFSGSTSTAGHWACYLGTRDPHHEVVPSCNAWTIWRDADGVVRRAAYGSCDVSPAAVDSLALGLGLSLLTQSRTLRLGVGPRAADIREGLITGAQQSLSAHGIGGLAWAAADAGYVSVRLTGLVLGTADFSAQVLVRLPSAAPGGANTPVLLTVTEEGGGPRLLLYLNAAGDLMFSIDTGPGTVNGFAAMSGIIARYGGQSVVLTLVRTGTTVAVLVQGLEVLRLTNAIAGQSFTGAGTLIQSRGTSAASCYGGALHGVWVFGAAVTGDTAVAVAAGGGRSGDLGSLVLDLDVGVGLGWQIPDRGPNAIHGRLLTGGTHLVPRRQGQVRATVAASGNTQIVDIPTNGRIRSITANAAGSVTMNIGNASAGTQIVNAAALTSGRQDLTLVNNYSSTGALWVNLSSAVSVQLTVQYDLVD